MLTLLISLIVAISVASLIYVLIYSIILSIIAFFIFFFGINFIVGRIVYKKLTALFNTVEKDMSASRFDQAITKLKDGLKLSKWQFFIKRQIYSQIGIIYYLKVQHSESKKYLEKGFIKNWLASSMLAAIYFKNKEYDKMKATMEKAIKASKKEGFIYSLYAYFLSQLNEKDKAIAILNQGAKKVPLDEKLQANLDALKNGKKMKMQNYGQLWMQLNIAKLPQGIKPYQMILANKRFKPK